MRVPLPAASFLFLLASALPLPAGATTMRHLDTRGLTLGSSDIVIGEVESVSSHWDATHRHIFTDVGLKISSTLKGGASDHLTLTQLGGEVDGVRVSVPGGPLFKPGGQALLFVWRDTHGVAQVNALAQGKFDIEPDPATGTLMVQRNTPGYAVRDVKKLVGIESATPAARLPLDDLVREIRSALSTEAGR